MVRSIFISIESIERNCVLPTRPALKNIRNLKGGIFTSNYSDANVSAPIFRLPAAGPPAF